MNPKQFLQWGGVVLVLVGILGFVGVIGPKPSDSIFGDTWWFDNKENVVHTILGVVALGASVVIPGALQRPLVFLVGILALFFSLYNVFSTSFLGANLESPADLVLHLGVGTWAVAASWRPQTMATTSHTPPSGAAA